jgi:DNA (cytosine-5)-methyltransferase 1
LTARDVKGADNIYAEENKLVVGSLAARDHKGVGNQYVQEGKLVVEPFTGSSHAQYTEGVGTLRANGGDLAGGSETLLTAIPIQDGREMHKNQNGLGIGKAGAPAYTLDQTGAQSIAIGIQGNVIGRQDHNSPAGKGHTEEGDPMFTLNATDVHAIAFSHTQGLSAQPSEQAFPTLRREGSGMAVAYDEYNDKLGSEVHHALRAGTKQSTGIMESTMTVRRLTPLECERLMGWPDNWTARQSDTHRYKQCGNGVASPVAEWIGRQLINLHQDTSLLL